MEVLEKILASSIELFGQYGFKSITMDDISRRAGISKKTLYQHFANKHEVVTESVVWYNNNTTCTCKSMLDATDNPLEAMVRIIAYFDELYRSINPMAIFELQRYFPEAYKTFRESLLERDVALIRENITQGMELGYYRQGINADLLARYRIETMLLALQPNLLVNDRSRLLSVTVEISDHFMYGILTPYGIQQYLQFKKQYFNQPSTSVI